MLDGMKRDWKRAAFRMTPELLVCLTGEVAMPFSELRSTERGQVYKVDPKSSGNS